MSLLVFVSATSLFTAAMAVAIAPFQLRSEGITGSVIEPSNAARWSCYVLAALTVANGVYVARKGRKNYTVLAAGTALFVIANIAVGFLYARIW